MILCKIKRSLFSVMTILSTPKAAEYLRCSPQFLKRKRDSYGGFLEEGKHYFYRGEAVNAAILWDVELIKDELHIRGMKARKLAGLN